MPRTSHLLQTSFSHRSLSSRLLPSLVAGFGLAACAPSGLEASLDPIVGALVEIVPDQQIRFGATSPVGDTVEKTLHIRATGDESVLITAVRLDTSAHNVFEILYDPTPTSLAPGEQVTVALGFLPEDAGTYDAILHVDLKLDSRFVLDRTLEGLGCNDQDEDGRCDTQATANWDTGYW